MKKYLIAEIVLLLIIFSTASFKHINAPNNYSTLYFDRLTHFAEKQTIVINLLQKNEWNSETQLKNLKELIHQSRLDLKGLDFWLRYLEPLSYKQINGPLPVEWETEVFEKYEKPYKRSGAGLTLAALYLEEPNPEKDSLIHLLNSSLSATRVYFADSINKHLKSFDHFYLCNRLFLLNLASIYTTGFECPDSERIIPELRWMLSEVNSMYTVFNANFPEQGLSATYLERYKNCLRFVNQQSETFNDFDHFTFLKDYINPLFALNQAMIQKYEVHSKSNLDYALNKSATGIFSKSLYAAQNSKGVFLRVYDSLSLKQIEDVGKLLFYDPILSGNNLRSCASCHQPNAYFTENEKPASLQFNRTQVLSRNSPSLLNTPYNHLLMLDGKHLSLQEQTRAVITNPVEMGCKEVDILKKVLSCADYKKTFKKLLNYTPQETEITIEHICSAITYYYSKFSRFYSPFDEAMNYNKAIDDSVKIGFNLFMGKAQCATCHFVPQFNGVKPPYIGSEFEVLGVPYDTAFSKLSDDLGRYTVNPATETHRAFRTGSLRNISKTAPYMHNGVFTNLNQVLDFYNAGGGVGKGLKLNNQTLSSDSLHLTSADKKHLIAFMNSLNERIVFEGAPEKLPVSKFKNLNARKIGGEY